MLTVKTNPIILYRQTGDLYPNELNAIKENFPVSTSRMKIPNNSLVIGRYSVLPFYKELEDDLATINSTLINSYTQHQYVADLQNYYNDFNGLTPQTWFRLENIPENGPFILKGLTNSRKHLWKTHMFAENKQEAVKVASRLYDDPLISQQGICIRKYIPLVNFGTDLAGIPISQEYRFFILDGQVLTGAFYWSNYANDIKVPDVSNVPIDFLAKVSNIVKDKIRFVVVDVAKTMSGEWIVIELNDGQMSGLSENDPFVLYSAMRKALSK